MKIIYNKLIPFKGYSAINLFGIVFASEEDRPLSYTTIKHELIHTEQLKKYWYIGYYPVYLYEFIKNLMKYKDWKKAYRNISFEEEAYKRQYEQ